MATRNWRLGLAELDALLDDPLDLTDPEPEALAGAIADARELARDAYETDHEQARLFAERVLHTIQVRSHFSPPLHAIASIYWGFLVRAKLRRELQVPAAVDHLSEADLRSRLQAAVSDSGCHNHPLLDRIADDESNRTRLLFVKNWYGSCQGFSHQLIQLAQRSTGPARRSIAENIADELAGVGHDELRMRFIESVGYSYDAGVATTDPDRVPESYALMSFRTALCQLKNTLFALGSFYTTEANWPLECKRMLVRLRKGGSSEHNLEYWTTHAYADEHHAAEWLDVLLETALTPAARAQVLTGALAQLQLRRRMYDTILARAERGERQ